ncbi:MAG: hypothetical protein ABIP03_11555 [Aquihabitans sp.]
MSITSQRLRHRFGRRWSTSERSPTAAQAAMLSESQRLHQPTFITAVRADTAITAQFRGDYYDFRTPVDAMIQAIRLACITDSFFAQVCYRAEVACRQRQVPAFPWILHRLSISCGQISIGPPVVMRPGVYIPHGQVVIDGLTMIEPGVVLRPFITIGLRDGMPLGPTIGENTRIGTGAKVFGPVTLGPDVQVGANAVVTRDVPAGHTAVGIPARVLDR